MTNSQTLRRLYRPKLDWIGAITSGACAVHCVALPVLAVLLPSAVVQWVASPLVHHVFAGLVMLTSLLAFVPGWMRHGESRLWGWVGGGLALILYARMADPGSLSGGGEALCTTLGGVLLMVAHRLNHTLAYWTDRL